jgi:hypothetical protein
MKKIVNKIGVYLCDKETNAEIYCGDVWQTSENKWSGAFCKALPKKKLSEGDFTPRASAETQQEASAVLAKIAQKEFNTTASVIKFGSHGEKKKKPLPFTFA